MHLSNHSLRQIDDNYLRSLGTEELRGLSLRLLADLKEAREQLNRAYLEVGGGRVQQRDKGW